MTTAIENWKNGIPDNRMVPQRQWREAEDRASAYRMQVDALKDVVAKLERENRVLRGAS